MVSMDAFASAFGFDAKSDDVWTTLGKVTAVNGNVLSVLLGGSATPMECESYCVATTGDVVFVVISKGRARAIAAKGAAGTARVASNNYFTAAQQQLFSGNKNWSEKDTAVDLTTANNGLDSGTRYHEWLSYDKNNYIPGGIGNEINSSGEVRMRLRARNYKTGTTTNVDNNLALIVAKDGTRSVAVSEAAPWRAALGLNVFGSLYTQSSSLTLTTTTAKVPLATFSGTGCSASSNGIKVPSAGTYLVWASAYIYSGYTEGDLVHLEIKKGSTLMADTLRRAATASPYEVINVGPVMTSCAANDVLYLYAYNQTGARGTIASRTGCGLTVLKIA